MSEINQQLPEGTPQKSDVCISESNDGDSRIIHGFHIISPDIRSITIKASTLESDTRIYRKIAEVPIQPREREQKNISKLSILGSIFKITDICFGVTIFTFAVKAKSFGLIWFLIACIITGIINYWTIMRGAISSFKYPNENNYSILTEKILGKKPRLILNVFTLLYSYACMICFLSLIFPLFGRVLQNLAYNNEYNNYSEFEKNKWGKGFIKFPFFVAITFFIGLMCLKKDIKKLNFTGYIEIGAVIYTLFVVIIQCNDYYNYYKKTKYVKNDKSTHANLVNLKKSFTEDLDFFKGMAQLFCAYACHPRIFSIYGGFKNQPGGLKKLRYGVFLAICLTTGLYLISIVCSFLTDPYTPEDLIIYRKNKGNGKDIAMTISKLFLTLSLIFNIPGYYHNLRLNIVSSFMHGKISERFNYIFTFLSCLGCAIIAAIYNKTLNYICYIGVISVFICYLFPILMYVYSSDKKLKSWRNILEIIFAVILCIIGVIAGIVTLIDDIKH